MGNNALVEKCIGALRGSINELIAGSEIVHSGSLLHASHGAHGKYSCHTQGFQGMNVGSIVYAGRQRVVSRPWQTKGHSHAWIDADDGNQRFSKGGGHPDFFEVREPFHLVETTASDDADLGIWTACRGRFRLHSMISAVKIVLFQGEKSVFFMIFRVWDGEPW